MSQPAPDIRPDTAAFLAMLAASNGPKVEDLPPEGARMLMRAMKELADRPRGEIALVQDIAVAGADGPLPARHYDNRPDRAPGPVMVFFHGGGFVIGDLDTHDAFCAEAARRLDLPVIAIAYRLAPEHPFPAGPRDCAAAARWVAAHIPCTGLVLAGDSAGGGLAITTAISLRDAPAAQPVRAVLAIYPVVSARSDWDSFTTFASGYLLSAASMAWFGGHYGWDRGDAGGGTDWRADPLASDLSGLPPTVVVTAGLDPLRDQGRAFAAKLADAGVRVVHHEAAGLIHGFVCLTKALPSASGDIGAMLDAVAALVRDAEARP